MFSDGLVVIRKGFNRFSCNVIYLRPVCCEPVGYILHSLLTELEIYPLWPEFGRQSVRLQNLQRNASEMGHHISLLGTLILSIAALAWAGWHSTLLLAK